jgi:ABC-type lipoprotein release transport system permease subunit
LAAFLTIAIVTGALLALVTGVSALRAGLRLRRARAALEAEVGSEVIRLAGRASELEESISALNARAEALPIRISELQHNLATLGVLTSALGASLRQAQKVLTSAGMKSAVARPIAELSRSFRSSRP